jgi:hypothetical protein
MPGVLCPIRAKAPPQELDLVKEANVCCGHHRKVEVHQDPYPRVSLSIRISVASSPYPQHIVIQSFYIKHVCEPK